MDPFVLVVLVVPSIQLVLGILGLLVVPFVLVVHQLLEVLVVLDLLALQGQLGKWNLSPSR